MGYTIRSDPALMGPKMTVFTVAVMDGDRIVRPPSEPNSEPAPPVVTSGDDSELWVQNGPPPSTPPPGAEPGDAWIDVATGDVYVLDE